MKSEIELVLGGVWPGLVFASVVVVVAALSNAGVLRTPVRAARPGSAWGAIFCMAPVGIMTIAVIIYRTLLAETGTAYSVIMYSAILALVCVGGFGIYLILASRPPRAFIPTWLRKS